MGYRNKTYIIFDGDEDMWAYGYMKGWKANENVDFDFHDAHDLRPLTALASEDTVKRSLKTRFASAKQVIVLVGAKTKNLYRFVRWEIDVAMTLGLPIVAVNLNGKRMMDPDRCPPILKGEAAVHVSYNRAIIQHALNDFVDGYVNLQASGQSDFYYPDSVYSSLGL